MDIYPCAGFNRYNAPGIGKFSAHSAVQQLGAPFPLPQGRHILVQMSYTDDERPK